MSRDANIRSELEPGLDPAEVAALTAVWDQLEAERPVPRPRFRGDLGRYVMAEAEPGHGPRPRRLRLLLAGYGGSGLALMVVAAIGVLGGGPLAS